jgi:methionyl-tRNA formyltransferase
MKIIFCGTSEFAVPVLRAVLESRHEVLAVVTKSEKPSGRGLKERPTAVKSFVQQYSPDMTIIQPPKLKDRDFQNKLHSLKVDAFVVASFPIMPMSMVEIPARGCINIHPSMLPLYRGAAPIQWALIDGAEKTGVSTFIIGKVVDAGKILLQGEMDIYPDEYFGSLHDRLSMLAAELAVESIDLVEKGNFKALPQDESKATAAPKIKKEDLLINWNNSAVAVYNRVRAFSPSPGAYTILNGKRLKILKAKPDYSHDLSPGAGLCHKTGLFAGCSDGALELLEVQMEGKKCLSEEAFICGFKEKELVFSID